jgi:hypothetical protein
MHMHWMFQPAGHRYSDHLNRKQKKNSICITIWRCMAIIGQSSFTLQIPAPLTKSEGRDNFVPAQKYYYSHQPQSKQSQ